MDIISLKCLIYLLMDLPLVFDVVGVMVWHVLSRGGYWVM